MSPSKIIISIITIIIRIRNKHNREGGGEME